MLRHLQGLPGELVEFPVSCVILIEGKVNESLYSDSRRVGFNSVRLW